jgi:arylsulfatase A-like enzyme
MSRLTRYGIFIALVGVFGAIAYQYSEWVLLRVPGWLRNPHIEANRPVEWAKGPDSPAQANRPPNVVVILADDLGFNDVTFYGGGIADGAVPTPNIDRIGKEGVNFRNGYAGNATCAPSRAAIMTGRYPTRFGFEFTPVPATMAKFVGHFQSDDRLGDGVRYLAQNERDVPEMADQGIPTNEITIAKLMQSNGYHTIHFGKWHLGENQHFVPENRGFDESLGFYSGASMFLRENDPNSVNAYQNFDPIDKFLWANVPYLVRYNGSKPFYPDAYMTDYLGQQAARAIEVNKNRPFFIYLAFNAPHTPLQALKSDYDALPQIADHRLRVYGAMVRSLDRNVGVVLDALKAQGLDDNTLVIFTSDNGGANYIGLPKINQPYRGWKLTFFEGGIHTPYFMRWPAKIPAGISYDRPVSHFDIFATAAGAAGIPTPADRVMDGVDVVPYVTGARLDAPHELLFWRSGQYKVVRAGDWKYQISDYQKKVWLFDLKTDPTEQINLAESNPAKVAELAAQLAQHEAAQVKPLWPTMISAPVPIDRPLGQKGKTGEEYVYWDN